MVTFNVTTGNSISFTVQVTSTGTSTTVNTPGSTTDNAIVRWDGTGGATIANSGVTIDDSNNVAIPQGARFYLDGGTDTYFIFDGTNLDLYINGVQRARWQ